MKLNSLQKLVPISVFLLVLGSTVVIAQSPEKEASVAVRTMPPAAREIVKLTDNGFVPRAITISQKDSSIFFLNATEDFLATLAIDFGEKRIHCASGNLSVDKSGVLRSTKPVGPRDFAMACFPEAGTYKVTAKGLKGRPDGYQGSVTIE